MNQLDMIYSQYFIVLIFVNKMMMHDYTVITIINLRFFLMIISPTSQNMHSYYQSFDTLCLLCIHHLFGSGHYRLYKYKIYIRTTFKMSSIPLFFFFQIINIGWKGLNHCPCFGFISFDYDKTNEIIPLTRFHNSRLYFNLLQQFLLLSFYSIMY